MSAERFRQLAAERIQAIQERGNPVLVVGGSGLYIKALTHGIRLAPQSDSKLQNELGKMSLEELQTRLLAIDPTAASRVDLKNPRRIIRALELSVAPSGPVERTWLANEAGDTARGVFVTRDRDELKTRINQRVEEMFAAGVVEEV